jgi:hypothetical protein
MAANCSGPSASLTEQLLGQFQHSPFVPLRHPENLHDDMERIAERNVSDEIAPSAMRRHFLDGVACDRPDLLLEFSEIAGQEPGLRQCPVFRMVRSVHLDQRTHQIRPPGDLAHALLDRLRRERRRTVCVVKQIVLPADALNLGVLGHDPERIETLWPSNAKRVVRPKPAIGVVKTLIGIGSRVH